MSCRLPTHAIPRDYQIDYTKLDLTAPFVFEGDVTITLDLPTGGPENFITLHCLDLCVSSASFTTPGGSSMSATSLNVNVKKQTLTVVFDSALSATPAHGCALTLRFGGRLNDQMHGLYRSKYSTSSGEGRFLACTQFEATDARRAFPCFDEPALKATFQLAVTVGVDGAALVAVSNTTVAEVREFTAGGAGGKRYKTFRFERTPLMSTYLAALVVGEFDVVSKRSAKTGIQTSVYTMPSKSKQGLFCLDTALKALDFFIETYDYPYPLSKSDLLAIPDFAAGAMENWGCVTYREAKILTDVGTSLAMKRGIARTVCHELAHQWFGNLTTMEWWDGLFLNEGFARFMEFKAIDFIFPEWDIYSEFVQGVFFLAQGLDAMLSSHPILCEVNDPDEISSIFDAISYAKGACVIRMCEGFLGKDVFMKGIQFYLKKYAYANAKVGELWAALEEFSGKPVSDFMTPWTSQVGFPLLTVDKDFNITQTRFFASGPTTPEAATSTATWPCPMSDGKLVYVRGESDNKALSIKDQSEEIRADLAKDVARNAGGWFKLNVGQVGFYRVNYTKEQWIRLAAVMAPGGPLSTVDRLGVVSDVFAVGKAGYSEITVALELVSNFGLFGEDNYIVWQELSEQLSALSGLYANEDFFPDFQRFLMSVYGRQAEVLGWDAKEGEAESNAAFRAEVIGILGSAGDCATLDEALRRFDKMCETGEPIHADLRRVVYKLALKRDEKAVLGKLMTLFKQTTFPEEQRNLMLTVGEVKDDALHTQLLDWTLWSGDVKLQDIAYPLSTLGSTRHALKCWTFFKENFGKLQEHFGKGKMWGSVVALLIRGLEGQRYVDEINSFFKEHEVGSAKRRVEQAVEAILLRENRLKRDRNNVKEWLQKRGEGN